MSLYSQKKGPHGSIPRSRRQIEVWDLVSPTKGAKVKAGSVYPRVNTPQWTVCVCIPNSRGQTQARESAFSTQQATMEVGVRIPDSRGHTKALESAYPTQGATQIVAVHIPNSRGHIPNSAPPPFFFGSRYPPIKSVGVHIPHSKGHAEACEFVSQTQAR